MSPLSPVAATYRVDDAGLLYCTLFIVLLPRPPLSPFMAAWRWGNMAAGRRPRKCRPLPADIRHALRRKERQTLRVAVIAAIRLPRRQTFAFTHA